MLYCLYQSPIGPLLLVGDGEQIHQIVFPDGTQPSQPEPDWQADPAPFKPLINELEAYFDGTLKRFSVPLCPQGTQFQQSVWAALQGIDYGETRSYRDIATQIGKPSASRAVGAANGANPIPIVIPCHRVIGTNGTLTGFAGGLYAKHWLLTHEAGEQSLFPFEEWLTPQ